jgi:hypothetical protein
MLWWIFFVLGWLGASVFLYALLQAWKREDYLNQDNAEARQMAHDAAQQRMDALQLLEKAGNELTIERERVHSLRQKLTAAHEKAARIAQAVASTPEVRRAA